MRILQIAVKTAI